LDEIQYHFLRSAFAQIIRGKVILFPGAVFSTELGKNSTMEEEAFRIALDHVNNDTFNYPEIKLRGLISFADSTDDFDNIEQGEKSSI